MYQVKFALRADTNNYIETNLIQWKEEIIKSINAFNSKGSRITDKASMNLLKTEEKFFQVGVDIDERFNPSNRSFYTRIGAISRNLKELGMHTLLSPHGKLFSLEVEGEDDVELPHDETTKDLKRKNIFLDYKNKHIMIPKEMIDEYSIKFY